MFKKLVKAIQIIVAEEIKVVLPKLVKEGVKKEMAKLLRENKQLKTTIILHHLNLLVHNDLQNILCLI